MEQHYAVPESRLKQLEDGRTLLIRKLGDMTRDRNEWKAQHENLLHMYQDANARIEELQQEIAHLRACS